MKFRTEFTSMKSPRLLHPDRPMVMIGSCFTQNMAEKMRCCGMTAVNPAGTLYNPFSMAMAADLLGDNETGLARFEKSLFNANGLWNSWWFDSSFSSRDRENCIKEFLMRQEQFCLNMEKGRQVIVTFGTSICYYLSTDERPVGNCHKQPGSLFHSQRLTPSEILSYWSVILEQWKERFGDVKVIFTVSPVRHLKDGFTANSRSKAVLQLAIEEIIKYNPNTDYFPAYEILNDDLRDYRFYAADLTHPSDEAIEYIWQKFVETYFDAAGLKEVEEGLRKYKAAQHRPKTGALGLPLN